MQLSRQQHAITQSRLQFFVHNFKLRCLHVIQLLLVKIIQSLSTSSDKLAVMFTFVQEKYVFRKRLFLWMVGWMHVHSNSALCFKLSHWFQTPSTITSLNPWVWKGSWSRWSSEVVWLQFTPWSRRNNFEDLWNRHQNHRHGSLYMRGSWLRLNA